MSSAAETHRYVSASIVPRQPAAGVGFFGVDTRKKKLEMRADLLTLQGSRMNV